MPLCPQITNTPITVTQTADFTVSSVVPAVPDTADGLANTIDQIVLNSGAVVYYQASAPTDPSLKEGDLWFDTDDGYKQYYYNGTAWVSVQDTAIAAAQSAATAAQTTADGKNRVYRQTTQPSTGPFAEGDLWFDTDDDNKIYRYTSGSWGVAVPLGNNALANLSANKITSGTIDASVITVSNLNAGNISTGTLAADRIAAASITGAKLVAGTITGDKIAAATITASQIAAGSITTDKLVAGTLTGYTITNGSSFNVTAAGTLTAATGTIGGFTIGATSFGDGTNYISTGTFGQASFDTYIARATGTAISMSNGGNIAMGGGNVSNAGTVSGTTISGTNVSASSALSSSGTLSVTSTATFSGANNSFPNITQSTAAANLRWGTTTAGRIFESTASSARFKTDIVDLVDVEELNPKKLLDLPVHAFRYKDDYLGEEDERSGALVPGFIAEEVDQFYPIAADYELGQPNNWNDKFMIPAMLSLIQDLYKEIALLKGE